MPPMSQWTKLSPPVESNYRDKPTHEQAGMPWFTSGELHGVSVFLRDGDSI
jgi:hypothetical protein